MASLLDLATAWRASAAADVAYTGNVLMPYDLPRSVSSFVFLYAVSKSPASAAAVACGHTSRGATCSARAADPRQIHASTPAQTSCRRIIVQLDLFRKLDEG